MRSPARSERRGDPLTTGDDNGQSTVEVALTLPLLMLLLFAGVQITVIIRDQLAVVHAAREGARAAAVSSAPGGDGATAARQAVHLDGMNVAVTTSADTVTVTVRHRTHTDVPLVGLLIPDVDETATATMRLEP